MKFYFGELRVCWLECECLSRILHKNCFQGEVLGSHSGVTEGIVRRVDWSIVNDVSKEHSAL
jgi:hypothetical protein